MMEEQRQSVEVPLRKRIHMERLEALVETLGFNGGETVEATAGATTGGVTFERLTNLPEELVNVTQQDYRRHIEEACKLSITDTWFIALCASCGITVDVFSSRVHLEQPSHSADEIVIDLTPYCLSIGTHVEATDHWEKRRIPGVIVSVFYDIDVDVM